MLSCDGCSLCCRLLAVEEIDKPACHWCKAVKWSRQGGRCGVYPERPDACRTFQCVWLQSQERTPANGFPLGQVLPPELRPDRCHVVFCQGGYVNPEEEPGELRLVLFVDPDYPNAWKLPGPMQQINGFLSRDGMYGLKAIVEINIDDKQITMRRGTGKRIIETRHPYYGMLTRAVLLPGIPDVTLDAATLMRRTPNG